MALTEDRNTPRRDARLLSAPVAAGAKCFAGGIACVNAAGFVTPGTAETGLTYLGRFEEYIDNHLGNDGAIAINISRNTVFKWENSSTDAIVQAALGKNCYIEDDETVSLTDGGGTRSIAGIILQVEPDGVWVE